jgi:hypothetical protein
MKKSIILFIIVAVVCSVLSCRKQETPGKIANPVTTADNKRVFRFQLYTTQDFSADNHVINFSLFVKNATRTLFDSSIASMRIKDIPDADHKLVIEKTVSDNDNTDLAAGFRYEIQGVGISWFIDTSKAGSGFKIIDYAFQ